MNNSWSNLGLSRTAAGTMFGILAAAALANQPIEKEIRFVVDTRIRSTGLSATSGSADIRLSTSQAHDEKALVAEIAKAYEQFAIKQKPLEQEFAKLLTMNLWELYAR